MCCPEWIVLKVRSILVPCVRVMGNGGLSGAGRYVFVLFVTHYVARKDGAQTYGQLYLLASCIRLRW